MLKVRDVMTSDVVVVSPETTIREAMELFARRHVSGAPVVSGHSLLGVVTNSDLLAFGATLRGVPSLRSDGVAEAEWEPAMRLPEVEEPDSPSAAFFSELWDDAGADTSERFEREDAPEWNELEQHDVSEVMTREIWSLPGSAPAQAAAELMQQHGIHRVLVVDDDQLVGIVTSIDIAKAVADKRFTTRTYVFPR
jgi:CBS domain-containing protein